MFLAHTAFARPASILTAARQSTQAPIPKRWGTNNRAFSFRGHECARNHYPHRDTGDRRAGSSHFPRRHRILVGVAENEPADVARTSGRHAFHELVTTPGAASAPRSAIILHQR